LAHARQSFLLFFFASVIVTIFLLRYSIRVLIEVDYPWSSEDNRGSRELNDYELASWRTASTLSIACSGILTSITLLSQGCLLLDF
jgi:hypothetical protein